MSQQSIEMADLWSALKEKFCQKLKQDFSNKDVEGWLHHFAPNEKINVYQYGKDVTGKTGQGKTIKIFTGSIFAAFIRGRIPAKLMAKTIFKRLAKQDYSHSEIELLGIQTDNNTTDRATACVQFERFNKSGEIYTTAVALYSLKLQQGRWSIYELAVYDEIQDLPQNKCPEKMWQPPT